MVRQFAVTGGRNVDTIIVVSRLFDRVVIQIRFRFNTEGPNVAIGIVERFFGRIRIALTSMIGVVNIWFVQAIIQIGFGLDTERYPFMFETEKPHR